MSTPLFALPGTLLDGRSLAGVLDGLGAQVRLLGEAEALDDEVDRLAAQATAPAIWIGHSLGGIVAFAPCASPPRLRGRAGAAGLQRESRARHP